MRLRFLATALIFLAALSPALADKSWSFPQFKLVISAPDSYKKVVKKTVPKATLELFDAKQNAQLLVSVTDGKPAETPSAKVLQKAFPVLASENQLTMHGEPTPVKFKGGQALIYQMENSKLPNYQTVYAYVEKKPRSFILILNYASPRNNAMLDTMKKIVTSTRNS